MRTSRAIAVGILLALAIIAVSGLAYLRATGLSARARPGATEARVARVLRGFAVPARARERRNPVASSPEVIEEGMAHFADHCAVCHGNEYLAVDDPNAILLGPDSSCPGCRGPLKLVDRDMWEAL